MPPGRCKTIRALDDTRLVDEASGWYDQGGGDVYSLHNYSLPPAGAPADSHRGAERVRRYCMAHAGARAAPQDLRLRHGQKPGGADCPLQKIAAGHGAAAAAKGLSALVYTQLTDVEDEVNGLFTYDRTAIKPDANAVRSVNAALAAEFARVVK